MSRLLTSREILVWSAAFVAVAVLLAVAGFSNDDPDSALYAALAAQLADGPVSHWIAPEWWGHWDSTGWFREHPAGVFLIPTSLAWLGVPAVPASYIVGVAAGLATLLLIGHLVARLGSPVEGRAVMVLLQIMPVAFLFRIRANHEYPMLVCLLLTLVGLEGVQRSWRWSGLVAGALVAAMLVKGVFVVLIFAAAGWWLLLDPVGTRRSWRRPIFSIVLGVVLMAGVGWAYDLAYLSATGERFWLPYWQRQMAPLSVATPFENTWVLARNVGFYLSRLLWHPAPWSVALLVVAIGLRRDLWARLRDTSRGLRRGLFFGLGFAALSVVILSPASRFAERYTFSAAFAIGACGIVVALRAWPSLADRIRRLDAAVPALPALVWLSLALARLATPDFH